MAMKRAALLAAVLTAALLPSLLVPSTANARGGPGDDPAPVPTLLASGLQGATGSTIGPDGALYVTEGATGEITRIDTSTGAVSTFASGLPPSVIGIAGAIDVAFVGDTAYALVSVVNADVGGDQVNGIYRIDDADSSTVIADIGAWSTANPPPTDFFLPGGVQFAIEAVEGGFLVTDGHHNRLLFVTLAGDISQMAQFENVVPTGIEVDRKKIYLTEAGPIPYNPEDGKVVSLTEKHATPREVASGFSLLIDVEAASCGLYALSQGDSPGQVPDGSPALPDSGELLKVERNGTLTVVVDGLDLPTSVDFVGNTAFIVTLNGEVWKVDDVASGQHGLWGGCRGQG